MSKKIVSFLQAFLVITALILSQAHMTFAAPVTAMERGGASGNVAVTDTPDALNAEVRRAGPPSPLPKRCALRVVGVAVTEPLPPGYPSEAAGPPYFGLDTLTDSNGDPLMQDPAPRGDVVVRAAGDSLIWVVMIQNSTNESGDPLCPSAETLTDVSAYMYVGGDDIPIPLSGVGAGDSLGPGELGWAEVTYNIPETAGSPMTIVTWAEAEDSTNSNPATGGLNPPPNDTADQNSDDITVAGPTFRVVSFLPSVTQASPGDFVDFTLIIENTRLTNTITGIKVEADDPNNDGSATFAATCTDYPFSEPGGNWTPVGGGAAIDSLAGGDQAQCVISGVQIPTSPIPDVYTIGGNVTVTDGFPDLDQTKPATSTEIDINTAAISVTKTITQIQRGMDIIYPPGPLPSATGGDLITYQITVTNSGDVLLNNLEIVDSLGGYLIPPTTTLDVDEQTTVLFNYVVSATSQDPLVNQVTVSAVSSIEPFNTVDAQASALIDILDSALEVTLIAEDPVSGLPITSVQPPAQVRYRLTLHNAGAAQIDSLSYISVFPPLQTVGTPPAIAPTFLVAGGTIELTWLYDVTGSENDPLVSTIRVRGIVEGSRILYGQDQAALDLATPGLNVAVVVLDPPTNTVLRGASVVYQITVTNTDSVNALCGIVVNQYLRDPDTGLQTPVVLDVPMDWPDDAALRRLNAGEAAVGFTTYLVTGADKDPLTMIFEATAPSDCTNPLPEPLIDRTTVELDISDAQVNAELVADVGADGVAEVGDAIPFVFLAQNVGAVTLENLTATWCIPHRAAEPTPICGLPFDPGQELNPTSIGAFEDTTGQFTYPEVIQPPDADAVPFVAEVTMIGTDNKGHDVSIKAATTVQIATAQVQVTLVAPPRAVVGDTMPVGFTITNLTGITLNNVRLYNMLVPDAGNAYGYQEVAYFLTISGVDGQNSVTGTFNYVIKPGVGIDAEDVLTLVARAVGTLATGTPVLANGSTEVEIVPMIEVSKTGDPSVVAGEAVNYAISFVNNSLSQTLTVTDYEDTVLAGYGVTMDDGDFTWDSGTPGQLGPGEAAYGTFQIPDPPGVDPTPTPLVNVVTITGTRSYDNAVVWGSDTWSVDIACPVAFFFSVYNTDDDPDNVLGEILRWQMSFRNVSQQTLTFSGITEELFFDGLVPNSQITWPGATGVLNPGQTALLGAPGSDHYFYRRITNEFYSGNDSAMRDTMTAEFAGGAVDLCVGEYEYPIYGPVWIIKVPDKAVAFPGEEVAYTIYLINVTEANDDPYDDYYVTVFDNMFPSPIPFPYDGPGNPATSSGWMGPGEEVEVTLTRTVLESDDDQLKNTARLEYPDPTDPNVILVMEAEALVYTRNPLALTKVPSTALAVAGTTITYDYTITNVSPYPVTAISMVDDRVGDLIPGRTGGLISLNPGESYTGAALIGVPYYIPLDAPDPMPNTATATGTILGREVPSSITVKVDLQDSEIEIIKYLRYDVPGPDPGDIVPETQDPEGTPEVDTGTIVHYCFQVVNQNPGTSTYVDDIVIQDSRFPGAVQTAFEAAVLALPGHPAGEGDRLYGQEAVDFCLAETTLSSALGDPVINLVTVDGTSSGGIPIYAEDELSVDILGTDLLITKIPSPPLAFVGDDVVYTITLYNNNPSLNIVNLSVTDTRSGGGTTPIPLDAFDWSTSGIPGTPPGELAPGGYARYSYTYAVQATDPDPLENIAATTGYLDESGLGVPPDEWTQVSDTTRAVVAVTASQLLVNKTASPTVVYASPDNCEIKDGIGDDGAKPACRTVRYTISITNVGTVAVQDITADDTHFDAETGAVVQTSFSGTDFTDDDLSVLETAFLFYDLAVPTVSQLAANPNLDPFLNTIEVRGNIIEDGQPAIVTSTADAAVDILQPNGRIIKSPAILAAAPGGTVTYNIIIENLGDETLTNLFFKDLYYNQADPPVEVVVDDINLDDVCPNDNPTICPFVYGPEPYGDYDNDPLTPDTENPKNGEPYNPDDGLYPGGEPGLMPGERLYGTVTMQVPADWLGSEFTNVVEFYREVTPGNFETLDRSSATIDIRSEGIEVVKLASLSSAAIGETVQYTVRVTNIGGTPLDRIVIADNAIDSDSDKSVTIENGFPDSPEDEIPGDDSETLDPGETYEMQYTHTLVPADGDPYVNRVTVTGFSVTGSVVNVAQSAVDVEEALLLVSKFVCAGDDINAGDGDPSTLLDPCNDYVVTGDGSPDVVTYYLHFQNPSAVPITGISVTDSVGTVGTITWPYSDGNGSGLGPNDGDAGAGNDELWVMYTYTIQPGDPDPLVNNVAVSGTATPGGPVQVAANATLALVSGDLLLTKTSVNEAVIGQTITYSLQVENLGSSSLVEVNVTDPLSPFGTSPIPDCYVGTLLPGNTHSCAFDYTISAADGSPLVNLASATALQGLVNVTDTATHTVQIVTGDLVVTKTADTTFANFGDDVTFTYQIENTGTSVIANLVVQDTDPAATFSPSGWPSSLAPGQVETRTWTRTMDITDPDPYINTVLVTGEVAGQPISAEATETVYLATGDLVVTNAPSATFVFEGQPVTFTYTISNVGLEDITTLNVSDTQCSSASLNGQLPSTTIGPGVTYTVYCTVPSATLPGPVVSTVYVSGFVGDVSPIFDSATAEVGVTSGGLLVTKTPDRTVALVGEVITYTVEVTNVGDETLTNFDVDDPIVPGLAPVPPDTLSPRQSFIMTGTYTVGAGTQSVSNVVTVTATDMAGLVEFEDSDSATVAVLEDVDATMALTKEVIPQRARPGETVTYIFTVRNISAFTRSDLLLYDPGLATATPPVPGGQVFLPPLDPGGVITLSYDKVVPGNTTQTTITNTAYVFDEGEVQDTAVAVLLVELLDVTKEADLSVVAPNDVITYTFMLENLSSAQINNVSLNDPIIASWLDPHTGLSLDGGEIVTISGTATVPADYAFATFDNTVQVLVGATVVDDATLSLLVPSNALTLDKTADPMTVDPGGTVTYTFTITNLSGTTIDNVTLDDALITALGGTWSDPLAGEPVPPQGLEITATVDVPFDYGQPTLENTAQLLIDSTVVDQASVSVDVTQISDLSLTKVVSPIVASPGDAITYTFTIENTGAAQATNVDLDDPVITTWDNAHEDLTIDAGETVTIIETEMIPADYTDPTFDNSATLLLEDTEVAWADARVIIAGIGLTLEKVAAPTAAWEGDTITYTFTIVNNTGAPVANVSLVDPVITTWNDPHTGLTIADSTPIEITGTAVIPDQTAPTFDNTAQLQVGTAVADTASASVVVYNNALNLTKTVDPTVALPDDIVTYTLTITNLTTIAINDVDVIDPVITTWNNAHLDLAIAPPPALPVTITGTATVTGAIGGTFDNTAQLWIGTTQVDTASASVSINQPGLLVDITGVIQRSADPDNPGTFVDLTGPFQTGEYINVTFNMENAGSETLTNLAYQAHIIYPGDPPLAITCQRISAALPSSLAPGADVDVTCQYLPPIAAIQYFDVDGLLPTLRITGTGQGAIGGVSDNDTEDIELVDLRLGIDLRFPSLGSPIGTNVTVEVEIFNRGASPIGCSNAVAASEVCHLAMGIFDLTTGNFDPVLDTAFSAYATTLRDTVLAPRDQPGDNIVFGPLSFSTLALKPYGAVVVGGYYDVVIFTPVNLLKHYGTYAEDVEAFAGELTVVAAVTPNPPTYGQPVTYNVTVTNTGQFPINNLGATYQISRILASGVPVDGLSLTGNGTRPDSQTTGIIALSPTTILPGQSAVGTLVKSKEDQAGTYLFSVIVAGDTFVADDTTGRADLTITPLGTGDLDPNGELTLEKVPNVTEVQPGDKIVWTLTLRNSSTNVFEGVTLQENVPDVLTIDSVTSTKGVTATQGQTITVTVGTMNPGETVTITVNTTVSPDAEVPSSIVNSACSTRTNGEQACKTTTVNVGPSVDTLPSTGLKFAIREIVRGWWAW